jgi:hypothetical protein
VPVASIVDKERKASYIEKSKAGEKRYKTESEVERRTQFRKQFYV